MTATLVSTCRSPSPEPVYDQYGKRVNTREMRTRRKLEEDRHNLVQKILAINSQYKPPSDYRPMTKRYQVWLVHLLCDHP
jgi:splicing factor 1